MLDREKVIEWLKRLERVFERERDSLTGLDAAIGDADHGINMDRGFKKVLSRLPAVRDGDIGSILRETGMALIASVGGASGPLYGTFFLKAAESAAGKTALETTDLAEAFRRGMSALAERGKAKAGDKTMLDSLEPAVEALEAAAAEGSDLRFALRMAEASAKGGMEATIPMVARKGRASYMGERSAGHKDPGATSSHLMIKALRDTLSGSGE